MPRIFICYRRGDSAPYAGRLYDRLSQRFGDANVFMDVDTVTPGEDFSEAIDRSLATTDVLIALIGPRWLSPDASGARRIDADDDLVRLEIAAALTRNIRVVPALVGGATMPTSSQLPASLRKLSARQALELSDTQFRSDVDRLIATLERARDPVGVNPTPLPSTVPDRRESKPRVDDPGPRWNIFAELRPGVVVGALALIVAAFALWKHNNPNPIIGAAQNQNLPKADTSQAAAAIQREVLREPNDWPLTVSETFSAGVPSLFRDSTSAGEWGTVARQITDGVYRWTMQFSKGWQVLFHPRGVTFGDFYAAVDIRMRYAEGCCMSAGLIFRGADDDGYEWRISVIPDSTVKYRLSFGAVGYDTTFVHWTPIAEIGTSSTIRLSVLAVGPTITYALNGWQLGEISDRRKLYGAIGLIAEGHGAVTGSVEYDNLIIRQPPQR